MVVFIKPLASFQSELTRRQSVFNEARDNLGESTIDIYKYQKFFREGRLDTPMPHLFIICDEFAELKSQQPDFMDNLISAARIGRSLGVHLILATQKPSGVVNDQIWSNTKFRVCLKVAGPGDSNEIIKRPDAAEIKNAGRFYLQVGTNELFVLGQSAYCGGPYMPSDEIKKDYDRSISFIDDSGQVIKSIEDESNKKRVVAEGDELSNILKYVTNLSSKEGLKVDNLWLDAMPEDLYLEDLIKKYNFTSAETTAIIGEYDDPSSQKQGILTLPLNEESSTFVFGLTASTREMFLREVIYSASTLYPSDKINFYIFDFGSETFKVFTKFPHVGDVVFANESEKLTKLFKLLQEEIKQRKALFVDYNGEYNIYCKKSGKQLPLIMVIINNYESFREAYSSYEELLQTLSREGKRYGIIFMVATSTRSGIFSRFIKNFDYFFALDMNNKEEYMDIFGKVGNVYPADKVGRGLFKKDKVYEYQTAKFCEEENLMEFISEKAAELDAKNPYKARKVPILPEVVTLDSISTAPFVLKQMPIGINSDNLELVTYNFLSDKSMVISANEFETIRSFEYSLLTLFENAGKIVTVVYDFLEEFEKAKDVADSYVNSNFEEFTNKILKFAEEKIINTEFNMIIFINGAEKFKDSISKELMDKLKELVTNNSNIRIIIAGGVFDIKKLSFESFYIDTIVNSNGIWIGSGFADQNVLRISSFKKEHTKSITNDFGWVIKNGKATLTKLLKCEVDDEEQDIN